MQASVDIPSSLCHLMDLFSEKNDPEISAKLFDSDLSPDSITNHLVMQENMPIHIVPCLTSILKNAVNALKDNSFIHISQILVTLNHIYGKLLIEHTESMTIQQKDDLAQISAEILRTFSNKILKEYSHIIEDDAGIQIKLSGFLLNLIPIVFLHKKLALEIVKVWLLLCGLNNGSRATQLIDEVWEKLSELVKETKRKSKKREFEYKIDPAIQLIQHATSNNPSVNKGIQLGNYMILKAMQCVIVTKCGSLVGKLLTKNQIDKAKIEINDAAKIISSVLGRMLQRAVNEVGTGNTNGEKAFMCRAFVEDLLQSLYDLSLPISSWIFRVLGISLIKLLETEKKNTTFRIFLTSLLVHCYQHALSYSEKPISLSLSSNLTKLFENCSCKGTLDPNSCEFIVLKCVACGSHFHNTCVGITQEETETSDFSFCCKGCLIKHKTISAAALCITRSKDKLLNKRCDTENADSELNNETKDKPSEISNDSHNKSIISKDLLIAYYDSKISEKIEDMSEAKTFSILKWIMHCDSSSPDLIRLYKQYMLSERIIEYFLKL